MSHAQKDGVLSFLLFITLCSPALTARDLEWKVGGSTHGTITSRSRLDWKESCSGCYCEDVDRVVLDDVDSVEDCFLKAISHMDCGTQPYQIYTDVVAKKARSDKMKGTCRCIKDDTCRIRQPHPNSNIISYTLKGGKEKPYCLAGDGACEWVEVGSNMLCDDNTRIKLSENDMSVNECGQLAFANAECESKPYQIYTHSGKCRCVKKDTPCVKKRSRWKRHELLGMLKETPFYEFSARHPPPVVETQELVLLVTRHGLSCANVASKWGNWYSKHWHANMDDPLLAKVGEFTTSQAALPVETWLENRSWQVDAVLSSVLARAVQTAALQYAGTEPIYMVPYIRESGLGKDNSAKQFGSHVAQLSGLRMVTQIFAPGKAEREAPGDWQKFKEFLEETFLPMKLPTLRARDASKPYVMAVVTHSNFMQDGEVKAKCGDKYPTHFATGKTITNNNQVVAIPYKLQILTTRNIAGDVIKVQHKLLDGGDCQSVTHGTALPYDTETKKLRKLCRKDIGDECLQHLQEDAYVPATLESEIARVEVRLAELAHDIAFGEMNPGMGELELAVDSYRLQQAELLPTLASLKTNRCWMGGSPER